MVFPSSSPSGDARRKKRSSGGTERHRGADRRRRKARPRGSDGGEGGKCRGGECHHPRRSRSRRSPDQSRRRAGDQPGDAVAARAGGRDSRALPVSRSALDELEQLTREIQDSVMAIRAQPVKSVFQRMPRLVREVAAQTGKAGAPRHRGRRHRGRQDGDRAARRSADAHDPQRHRPRPRKRPRSASPRASRRKAWCGCRRCIAPAASSSRSPTTAPASIARGSSESPSNKGLIAADATLTDDEIDNLIFLPGFSTASARSPTSPAAASAWMSSSARSRRSAAASRSPRGPGRARPSP